MQLLIIILSFLSAQVLMAQTGTAKESLYELEKSSHLIIEKILAEHSYQQVCLESSQQLTKLYTENRLLKGDISRIYFFCESAYDYKLSSRQRRGFEIWDIKDPVSIFECEREKIRQSKSMDNNPYIVNRCLLP